MDTDLTLDEIEELFYDLTVEMLGSSPLPDVRRSWPTGGAPAWEVSYNVTFLNARSVPSTMTSERESVYSQSGSPPLPDMKHSFTRTLLVNWIFYGPDSWTNAKLVESKIFFQTVHDELALSNLYMVKGFNPSQRIPELWQGQWYESVDLSINFNELVVIHEVVPYLESVEVEVVDGSGVRAEVEVTEISKVR